MSEKTPQSIRRIVAARACGYCEYCRCSEDFATESFTVEHIKPRQAGGETILENLAWSCFGCNGHKHTKTQATDPETGEKSPLYHPRQQVWSEHFRSIAKLERLDLVTIGANAVVTKSLPDNLVAAGVSAKIIRTGDK